LSGSGHTVLGVSLKLYFDTPHTLDWCAEVARVAADHPAVASGAAELFVLPTFVAVPGALGVLDGTAVGVGAQDLFWHDQGPYTGEVSGRDLAELGCRYVELGHSERRGIFREEAGETGLKLAAAVRNGLVPVLCVGESHRSDPAAAATECVDLLRRIFDASGVARADRIIVAYEPDWAIGSTVAADGERVAAVLGPVRDWLDRAAPFDVVDIIYGGSAGPGTLTSLGAGVDGLFLGRFAHDAEALRGILDESLRQTSLSRDPRGPRGRHE
jgi:triosephosphate isomerase